jgi:hypothetical protein
MTNRFADFYMYDEGAGWESRLRRGGEAPLMLFHRASQKKHFAGLAAAEDLYEEPGVKAGYQKSNGIAQIFQPCVVDELAHSLSVAR